MTISVFVEKVVNEINPALLNVAVFISLDAYSLEALNIPSPIREIGLLRISKRRLPFSMVVCNPATECYLNSLYGIHHQETQFSIKEIVSPYFIQRCPGDIVILNLPIRSSDTERVQIGTESVIAYIFQTQYQKRRIPHKTTLLKQSGLLRKGEMRFEIFHTK